ncbi:MAG: DNA helicase II, partial [Hydrogenophaga sp.]|nr:DNA helicase II [Hydrogenophaga sp.]
RARQRLYLTHAQTRMLHGQTRYNLRSRFFDELPPEGLKWLTPPQPAWSASGVPSGWGTASRAGTPVAQPAWSPGWTTRGAAAAPAPEPDRGTDIRAGMQVFHNKFGEGKVLSVEGAGPDARADARAQVSFVRHGVKWLALSVARLTPVTD